jgi:hypothetical protein
MSIPGPALRTFAICRSIVWLASWIAPAAHRVRWRSSWTKQAWHWCLFLAETGALNRGNKLELARFCWSAFPSAFWLRYDREQFCQRAERLWLSPSFCLGIIALAVAVFALAGGIVPVLRSFISSPIPDPARVQVISLEGKFRRVRSETLLDLAEAWKHSKLIEDVAPYSWAPAKLQTAQRTVPVLSARVAPDFFQVLGLSAALGRTFRAGDERGCYDCMVLSEQIWRLQFGGDRGVIGQQVGVDGVPRRIIGVLPGNFHLLPAQISAWTLLDSGTAPFSNFVERIGAVARTRPGASERKLEADLADLSENAGYVFPASLLRVTSGSAEVRRYLGTYLLLVLLAVGCAALIVCARGGGFGRSPLSVRDRLRWWAFFVTKAVLLLAATGLLAWTIVRYLSIAVYGSVHPMTNAVGLWVFLIFSIAPLSWAIRDQQRRCRVCLCRLGTPIAIGAPGHVLLDWSGTEMVCADGHGVLYLPDSQANWLERVRWDNLDASWAHLFKDSG